MEELGERLVLVDGEEGMGEVSSRVDIPPSIFSRYSSEVDLLTRRHPISSSTMPSPCPGER